MILFEKKESEALGETTMLQTEHPSQQKFFDLLGTRKSHPPLHSATTQCLVNLCSSIAICVVLLPLTATRGSPRDFRVAWFQLIVISPRFPGGMAPFHRHPPRDFLVACLHSIELLLEF